MRTVWTTSKQNKNWVRVRDIKNCLRTFQNTYNSPFLCFRLYLSPKGPLYLHHWRVGDFSSFLLSSISQGSNMFTGIADGVLSLYRFVSPHLYRCWGDFNWRLGECCSCFDRDSVRFLPTMSTRLETHFTTGIRICKGSSVGVDGRLRVDKEINLLSDKWNFLLKKM